MRYKSLDFWRGIACLGVVVVHSAIHAKDSPHPLLIAAQYGWLGVPMFFVISGYCISAAAENCHRKGHSAATYFWRRFRRIYPPYWIAVAAFAVLVGAGDVLLPGIFSNHPNILLRPWWLDGWQWLGNLSLTESWRHHAIGSQKGYFLGHAWSLCYEEQFYAVMGLALLARKRQFTVAAVVTAAVVGMKLFGHSEQFTGFFFDGLWLQFAAGIVVYCALNNGRKMIAVALLLAGLAWQWSDLGMAVAFGFALLLLLLHPLDQRMSDSRLLWPVTWCGTMCYSLYLVHRPVTKAISEGFAMAGIDSDITTIAVVIPLGIVGSVICGWLFHVAVERQFLNSASPQSAGAERPLGSAGPQGSPRQSQ